MIFRILANVALFMVSLIFALPTPTDYNHRSNPTQEDYNSQIYYDSGNGHHHHHHSEYQPDSGYDIHNHQGYVNSGHDYGNYGGYDPRYYNRRYEHYYCYGRNYHGTNPVVIVKAH